MHYNVRGGNVNLLAKYKDNMYTFVSCKLHFNYNMKYLNRFIAF